MKNLNKKRKSKNGIWLKSVSEYIGTRQQRLTIDICCYFCDFSCVEHLIHVALKPDIKKQLLTTTQALVNVNVKLAENAKKIGIPSTHFHALDTVHFIVQFHYYS
jgi:hypothetical protein